MLDGKVHFVIVLEHAPLALYQQHVPSSVVYHHIPMASDVEEFNKSRLFNKGVECARAPTVMLHDADILVPEDYVEIALRLGLDISELNDLAENSTKNLMLGSYCTVFAATEVLEKIRDGEKVAAFLNGNSTPELSGTAAPTVPEGCSDVFVGGRGDNLYNFHGKICEAAVYDRPLSPNEISAHYKAALNGVEA